MKQYVTVYDMIQKLAEFPADKYIEFRVWVHNDQLKAYTEEWIKDDYTRFDADQVDLKCDVAPSESGQMIVIEMDASDL